LRASSARVWRGASWASVRATSSCQLLAEGVDARFLLLAEGFQLAAQFLQALPHQRRATLLAVGGLGARLAGVFAQRFAQQVQALVGAGGQIGQRAGEAIELLAQFAAPGAGLLAHRLFRRSCGGRRSRATSCRMSTANRRPPMSRYSVCMGQV
jgi:pimeloyl-ACP methyl ester carboxylesterase